ncbi:MAG: chorismate--pyruvate lyase family protein [Burkholderiaceae bacterium]
MKSLRLARWRARVSPTWPPGIRDWLRTKGSLTVRLQTERGRFRVENVFQALTVGLSDERGVLDEGRVLKGRGRDVFLWSGGQRSVYAHSLIAWHGARCDWRFWRALGQRSLGSELFRDRTIERGPARFACLGGAHPLARAAGLTAAAVLYARRTRYRRRGGRTPLLVTEVFLPAIQTL